jgi:hypothetical protein
MKNPRGILRGRSALALLFAGVFIISFVVGCASGQPHMRSALDHLLAAKSELQAATSDKGGHRVRAIQLVDEAVVEIQRGMEYARGH